MLFISFYTPNGRYPNLAQQLKDSLEKHDLEYEIDLLDSFDSWLAGVDNKAKFIKQKLLQHKKTVVWLDIDTEVKKYPDALFGPEELALFNWFAVDKHVLQRQSGFPYDPFTDDLLNGGAVSKWSYNADCVALLDLWQEKLKTLPHNTDDQMLDVAWRDFDKNKLTFKWLPKEYNTIPSMFTDTVDPVILHHFKNKEHRDGNR
jgi:hypothetical protein